MTGDLVPGIVDGAEDQAASGVELAVRGGNFDIAGALGFEYSQTDELTCSRCGEVATIQTYPVSIHMSEFGDDHAGPGNVWWTEIPYCAGCDVGPADSACVHIPHLSPNGAVSLYINRSVNVS